MGFQVGPRTISATGGSIKRVGNYRVHTFPSELVTDGLVLNLDAGDPRSYPGIGTSWTDLSGNGRIGTLTNGPTYSNANGGSIVFDGTNDHILGTLPLITGEVTIEAWVKFDGVTNLQTVFAQGQDAVSFSCGLVVNNSQIRFRNTNGDFVPSSPSTLVTGQWYHLVFSTTGLLTTGYVNGISNGTTPNVISSNNVQTYKIGQRPGNSDESLDGNISIVRLYNRALSAAEVAQNYDALKVRYTGYTNTFTPLCGGGSGKVEVLCVAGGGGGGSNHGGGGGGAGGLLYNSALTVSSNTGIGVTIGAGGTTQINGGNTIFSSLTSIGGGTGATEGPSAGNSGGSGGGGSGYATATVGGSGTTGQGFDGGRGGYPNTDNTYGHGGGGGGAGSAGTDGTEGNGATVGVAGTGGNGLSYSITGNSQFYAGGGGGGFWGTINAGGLGGSGIGGRGGENGSGANTRRGQNAIPNTGSGGGGSSGLQDADGNRIGGNGSNGIVIVRYPATDYNVELLIVGGGGGTGEGGGGAGGLIYYSSYPVSAGTKYSVTIGAGGTAGGTNSKGNNGANSIFGPLVAIGGGAGGGGQPPSLGNNGGSGGGTSAAYGAISGVSLGTPGQGNNGGAQSFANGSLYASGGGGGAGAVGGIGNTATGGSGGVGGIGLAFAISGISTYYAGGGGGSGGGIPSGVTAPGGLGGGGTGSSSGTAGTPNTGGGGGGSIFNTSGAPGGSGIIIIAYQGPQRGLGGTVDTTSRPGYTLHTFTTTGTDFFIP